MSDMSNLYRAYSAVHNVEIKEELDQKRDQISEMNLSQVLQSDLVEVCEEIVEGLFEYGLDFDQACDTIATVLESITEGESNELREGKIDQIAEAFGTVVDTVTDKAERNCEEEFLLYRQNKPLTEKWNNRVSHEVGNEKLHASLIHEDRHQIKFGLIEMISDVIEGMHRDAKTGEVVDKAEVGKTYYPNMPKKKSSVALRKEKEAAMKSEGVLDAALKADKKMGELHKKVDNDVKRMKDGKKFKEEVSTLRKNWGDAYTAIYEKKKLDPVGQEDGDIDNDGDEDSSDKYLAKRRKAIGKAMKNEEVENVDEAMRPGERQRKVAAKVHDPYASSRTRAIAHNVAVRNDGPGTPGYEKKSTGGKGKRFAGYGDQGAGNKARRRMGQEPLRGNTRKEEVTFSEAELARIEEIVNSWED